jgi:hypothetical protein
MEFTTEELKAWLETTKHVDSIDRYIGNGEWSGYQIRERDGSLYAVGHYRYEEAGDGYTEMWEGDRPKRGYHHVRPVMKSTRTVEEEYYVGLEDGEELDV